MRFRTKFRTIELNLQREVARIDKVVEEATLTAASLWLGTVTGIVPVWSTASHATFVKLATAVGFQMGPLRVSNTAHDRYMLGFMESQGGLRRPQKGSMYFFYGTTLRYLAFNNENVAYPGVGGVKTGLIEPTPYKFVEAGQNTFEDFAKTVQLPAPVFTSKKI
jgi:ribulose kinase